jgi:large subunit ribosomal protein L13
MEIYIDASNLIVGRMVSYAAKKALLGNIVKILNCESAIITGNRKDILRKYSERRQKGTPTKGPFFPRMPDRFVRRVVRGMLPYKKPRGKEAFQRVMCYLGVPEQFKDKKMITLASAHVSKTKTLRFLSVKGICANMGGKV